MPKKLRSPSEGSSGFHQIGDPKGRPQGRSPASIAKAIERAKRKVSKALDPGPSVLIKRGTKP